MIFSPPTHWLFSFVILLNRLALGLFFLLAGFNKVRDGVAQFVEGPFKSLTPPWLSPGFATLFGNSLPYIEIVMGAMLLLGLFTRIASGAIALLLISFTIALAGVGAFYSGGGPFHTNLILLTLTMLFMVSGPGIYSVDAKLGIDGLEKEDKQAAKKPVGYKGPAI
jgi:uncharacterized membrane protein YphA (DoxX/SURF4 family)